MSHNDGGRPVQIVRGLPFPPDAEFKRENIEAAMDYEPEEGDIIVASYPKTGTTWLSYIVLQILSRGTSFPSLDDVTYKVVPFLEMTGTAPLKKQPKPSLYKHHLPWTHFKKHEACKCLYIYRNPVDVVVSYHRFIQGFTEDEPIDFQEFFGAFLSGDISYGSIFDHVKSFHEHREDANLLMVSYERLHANTRGEILKIASFLGQEHYKALIGDEGLLDRIIENTSFKNMKNSLHFTHPEYRGNDEGKKVVTFFRKGKVGDGKNVLTQAQRERVREAVEKTMMDTSIGQEWLKQYI